ncbi:hypothetical protein GGF32_001600 [Allomyces javanicus]|nr:hypothetical protein GGF32_001600 [Allomyces javanicus]
MFPSAHKKKSSAITSYAADFGRVSSSRGAANTLLVKSPVGKARPTCYTLPCDEHVYGKKVDRRPDETTAKVLTSWQTKQKSKNAVPSLDYVSMNKLTLHAGIVDPKGQYEHRKLHPIRMKVIDHATHPTPRSARRHLPSDTDPTFTYGKPTRPSSPVGKLMSDHYQREYDEAMKMREEEHARALAAMTHRPRTRKDQMVPLQHPKPKHLTIYERDAKGLFKMPRFRDVPARVDHQNPLCT